MKKVIDEKSCRAKVCRQAEVYYADWKEDHEDFTYQRLADLRGSEIVRFLNQNVLRFAPVPTGREVKERTVVIDNDSLEVNVVLGVDMDWASAQLSYFVSWTGPKNELLTIREDRMTKYLTKHQADMTEEDLSALYHFEAMLDMIHQDMAVMKPQLARYLKDYEANLLEHSRQECISVVNVCQPLLKTGIRAGILGDVVRKLMDDRRIGEEAQTKLCSMKTRNKYLCEMIAALDYFCIFRKDVSRRTLAKTLSQDMGSVSICSADDYIKKFQSAKSGHLFDWVKENIEDLKMHEYNPFEGLI